MGANDVDISSILMTGIVVVHVRLKGETKSVQSKPSDPCEHSFQFQDVKAKAGLAENFAADNIS